MKRASRIIFLISAALFALGLMSAGASLITGGSFSHIRDNVGISTYSLNFADEDIREIRVTLPAGNVVLQAGEEFGVVAQNAAEAYFSCGVKDGVLTVSEAWPGVRNMAVSRALSADQGWPQIVIFVPQAFIDLGERAKVSVSVEAGSCHVQNLALSGLDIKVFSGLISLRLPGGAGAYDISGRVTLGEIDVSGSWTGRGSYSYSNGNSSSGSKIRFDCSFGEVLIMGS